MRRLTLARWASLSALVACGALVGCGDNLMKRPSDGSQANDGSGDQREGGGDGRDGGEIGEAGPDGQSGDAPTTCPPVAFVSPTEGMMFTAANDVSGMQCAMGFKTNVTVSVTGAAAGTMVELHGAVGAGTTGNPPLLATGTVAAGQVVFSNVQLAEGMTKLTVEIANVPCTPSVTVTVDCNLPTCTISQPDHDLLNGVAAPAGDRASSPGSDYQAAFAVTTDIEDGQPVVLSIVNAATPNATPTTVSANATSGAANFAGVTLKPDGDYRITAACTNRANAVGHSMQATFTVDTTPPNLTVNSPANGATIGPGALTNGAFQVCATTTSADAAGLPLSARVDQQNLCVSRGGTRTCAAVATVNTSTCVNVACPGGPAFDLTVTLYDAAGNPSTHDITGVTCASTLPAVQIVAPLDDKPNFTDVSRHLLAASSAQTLKDADGTMAGAQTTVVACTDTMGASARLFAGHRGDANLTALGTAQTVVAAVAADGCPNGFGFVAKFVGVTLPESTELADGSLNAATEIRVDVTDPTSPAAVGSSGATDLWVDSVAPTVSEKSPMPLCGSMVQNNATFTTDVAFNSSTANLTMTVANGTTLMFMNPAFAAGTATFSSVDFRQGQNTVVVTAAEPSGNSALLTPIPMPACVVTVGGAPVVTFTTPTGGQDLCANGNASSTCVADTTAATPGWQGNITVHVTSGGAPLATGNVTFTIAGGAPQTAALDGSGNATLAGATVADGNAVTITATTDNVPQHGVGMNSIVVRVDTVAPGAATAVTATPLDRRQTSFTLSWTAPGDNGQPVADYDIHVKGRDSNTLDPCGIEIRTVPFTGTPVAVGATQSLTISNLFIETDYCFTVSGRDAVGNAGTIVNGMGRANFQTTTLTGMGTENMGFAIDGTADFGGPGTFTNDGLSDLIIGAALGTRVYVYFGRTTGYAATPDITITGPVNRFGTGAIAAGDVDGDGLTDIAIGSRDETPAKVYIFSRKNPPVSWGTTTSWPAALTAAQANYVITGDATYNATRFGYSLGRLGNIDGTGADDLAIGAMLYDGAATDAGRVVIVKGSSTFGSITLPDATNTVVIDGEAAMDYFGWGLEAVPGNTLVVSGYGAAPASGGKVYAFRSFSTPTISASIADDITVYPTAGAQYGFVLGTMGAFGMSPAAVTITSNVNPTFVDLHMVGGAVGPFGGARGTAPAPTVHLTSSATGNSFGIINIGGVVSGTSSVGSLIGGDNIPDLVLAGQAAVNNAIYIISGATLSGLTGNVDVSSPTLAGAVTVAGKLPAGWIGYGRGSLVLDLNGDGYADIALGEFSTGNPGRALVLW